MKQQAKTLLAIMLKYYAGKRRMYSQIPNVNVKKNK